MPSGQWRGHLPCLPWTTTPEHSPFDSLIWHRPRLRRLFEVEYLLEACKPATKRQFGDFAVPVLVGSTLTGRIAVRFGKGTAVVRGHHLIDGHGPPTSTTPGPPTAIVPACSAWQQSSQRHPSHWLSSLYWYGVSAGLR
ncbi:DNA glycosylase AlkZ-like family protein [Streptomyces sp. NPDC055794]